MSHLHTNACNHSHTPVTTQVNTDAMNPQLFIARAYAAYPELADADFTVAVFDYAVASYKPVTPAATPIEFLSALQKVIADQGYDVVAFETEFFESTEVCLMAKSLYQGIRSGTLVDNEYAGFIETANSEFLTKLDAHLLG